MRDSSTDKSQYIVESSLTELAFIFFFILLVFSALKISELVASEDETKEKNEQLLSEVDKQKQLNQELIETTLPIRIAVNSPNSVPEDEIFLGLEKDAKKAVQYITQQKRLEQQFPNRDISIEEVEQYMNAIETVKSTMQEVAPDAPINETSPEEIAKQFSDFFLVIYGQNENLKQKLVNLGNGLDHPPCWADTDGNIQFVYSVVISEDHLTIKRAWPDELQIRVNSMPYITSALGTYANSQSFWSATNELYMDSVAKECRHFVKIIDEATSKDAFKSYLLTIERHFYKLLI